MATKGKAKVEPKSKAKVKVVPTDHHILVDVDKKGNFTYKLKGGGDAASLLTRRKDDTISWSVRMKGKRVPFQVEFTGAGPFGFVNRAVRSAGKDTPKLTVNVPDSYAGNFVMEYRVTISNGWSDDPDVVPILSDGNVGGLVAPTVITIAEDGKGGLTVTPPAATAAINGPVLWKWSGTPKGDFTLTFDDPPPGWPVSTASTSQQIALTFPIAAKDEPYAIKVNNSTLLGTGKLTITA